MRTPLLLASFFLTALANATTCYTNCEDRFPKWYQAPDRARCNAEKAKACFEPSGLPGSQELSSYTGRYQEISQRLVNDFTEGGYVVSRRANQEPMHQGDSLLWSGIAMASLDCDKATPIREAILSSIKKNDGRILRFEPLPASYAGNETSRDAEVGALFGFAIHSLRCPGAKQDLREAWERHHRFVKSHDGRLHEGSNPNFYINPSLEFAWDLVSHHFLGTASPSDESRHFFEAGVTASTKTIKQMKNACYPVHLSTLLLVTAAKLGDPVNHLTRREFCHDTRGMNLPLTDWYCERGDAKDFLSHYELNRWEYRHQRCDGWESPDVDPGESSPGVDYLVYKTLAEG